MKRLFAAIRIEPNKNFAEVFKLLRNAVAAESIRWSPLENLHITLKFFGETNENMIPGICDALRMIKSEHSPFEINITGTGMFGSRYKPRVIWFGLKGTEPLNRIVNDLNAAIMPLGYTTDRQNFVPHLTAGRMNNIRDKAHFQKILEQYRNVELQSVSVSDFHLYESVLLKQGPQYHILESFLL